MAKQTEQYKIAKLALKAKREETAILLLRQLIASPLVQIIGTVALTEYLESEKVISSRWAGAVEGGVITMVGLQALKDYGVIGAGSLALGTGIGALSEGNIETLLNAGAGAASGGLLPLLGKLL